MMSYRFTVANFRYTVRLHFAETYSGAQNIGGRVFNVNLNGKRVLSQHDSFAKVGANTADIQEFTLDVSDEQVLITFERVTENPHIQGIEIFPVKDHIAHAVPGDPQSVVDLDADGYETVTLDGHYSHTHAPAPAVLNVYEWSVGGVIIGTQAVIQHSFPVGTTIVLLTVRDTTGAEAKEITTVTVTSSLMSGFIGYYYAFDPIVLNSMPTLTLNELKHGQTETDLNVQGATSNFKNSGLFNNFAASFTGSLLISVDGSYQFGLASDDGSILTINDQVVIDNSGSTAVSQKKYGTVTLTTGYVKFEVKYFNRATTASLILSWILPNSATEQVIPASRYFYNENDVKPVIHSYSIVGNRVRISGFGFVFPSAQTSVTFGTNLAGTSLAVVDKQTIEVGIPQLNVGQVVTLRVTTPRGNSNSISYTQPQNNIPVQFSYKDLLTNIGNPTCLQYGPDEKLYVGTVGGLVYRITHDDDNNVLDVFISNKLIGRNILGICFNPRDTNQVRVYVTHNQLYHGKINDDARAVISILSGNSLEIQEDIITGLPCSERDHGVNGCVFDSQGNLMFLVGSNTNGGLPGPLTSSGLETEKQFSASIAIAYINRPNFDGRITYSNNDAENGVQLTGLDVEVYAPGIKNGFNMVFHPNGNLYATDNGPTVGFGRRSTGCDTDGPDPGSIDKLLNIRKGNYYGHPVRARGRRGDPRQCVYRAPSEPSGNGYTAPVTTLRSSMNGIIVYTANRFGGALKNHLISSRFIGELYDITLTSDGEGVISVNQLSPYGGLNVVMAPNGALISTDYYNNKLVMVTPDEPLPATVYVISTFPVTGPINGGNTLTIYGYNLLNSLVTLGGKNCVVTLNTARKLKCTIPSGAPNQRVNMVVVNPTSQQQSVLTDAYKYMNV